MNTLNITEFILAKYTEIQLTNTGFTSKKKLQSEFCYDSFCSFMLGGDQVAGYSRLVLGYFQEKKAGGR